MSTIRNAVIVLAFICFAAIASASETEFIYHYDLGDTGDHVPHTIDNDAGVFEQVEFRYDVATETFSFETRLGTPAIPARLAKSFVLIVSPQRFPDMEGSEYAAFYFDATSGTPILSAYTYEPKPEILGWDSLSFLHGERICTSADAGSCSGWIQSLESTDHGDGSRTLGFVIDASFINSFVPAHPNENGKPWVGAQFAETIGFWLIPYGYPEMEYLYDSNGWLTEIDLDPILSNEDRKGIQYHGFFDGDDEKTFREPFCEPEGVETITAEPGFEVTYAYGCISPEGENFIVNYSGIPANASVDPEEGALVGSTVSGSFSFIPDLDQADQTFTIDVLCTEESSGTTISCPFSVEVPPVDLQCEGVDISNTQFELDSVAFSQFQLVKQLTKRLRKEARGTSEFRNARKFRKRTNRQARELYIESWSLAYSIDSFVQQCSSPFCQSVSNIESIDTYVANADELLGLARKTNRRLKRRLDVNARRLVRRSRQLSQTALESAATLPTESSQCAELF